MMNYDELFCYEILIQPLFILQTWGTETYFEHVKYQDRCILGLFCYKVSTPSVCQPPAQQMVIMEMSIEEEDDDYEDEY